MNKTVSHSLRQSLAIVAAAALFAGCADEAPLAPDRQSAIPALFATLAAAGEKREVAILRRVTQRYHDINVAIKDGFVLLHECESRPGEGPVGKVYVHLDRLMDGNIDSERPDALIYEPNDAGARLVGVEFAIPYPLWTEQREATRHRTPSVSRDRPSDARGALSCQSRSGISALDSWRSERYTESTPGWDGFSP